MTDLDELDTTLAQLLAQHSLQVVVESLRRIATQQVDGLKNAPTGPLSLTRAKWGSALAILARTDLALYGQHCGDVRPVR